MPRPTASVAWARVRVRRSGAHRTAQYSPNPTPDPTPTPTPDPDPDPDPNAVGYNYAAQYGPQPGDRILPTEGETWDPAMPEGWTEASLLTRTLTRTLTLTSKQPPASSPNPNPNPDPKQQAAVSGYGSSHAP